MTRRPCIIHLVAGTRPNIIKIAPLHKVLSQQDWCSVRLIFIQQHNSPSMTTEIFDDLGISEMVSLDLTATGYGPRMGEIIARYEELCAQDHPDMVVVSGDVDASIATTLAAKRLGIAPTTARTHLQRLFAKTGTARQSELVRFVATYVEEPR